MTYVVLEYKKLRVWQKSIELAAKLYEFVQNLPITEEYGLKSQIRRAAVSIPSNIAEGCSRETIHSTIHFLYISLGSLSEIETQLLLVYNIGYANRNDEIDCMVEDIRGLLYGLIKYLRKKESEDTRTPYSE